MRNDILEMAQRELKHCGIEFDVAPTHGGHWRITWSHRSEPRCLVVAFSPSDHRSIRNTRADLRRVLRRDGYAVRPV